MTSTVLDVTVMLLCVSASVVVLGGLGDDPTSTAPPSAETAADRLTTETATVEYGSDGGSLTPTDAVIDGTDGTVHATLAELLWMAAIHDADRHEAGGDADGDGIEDDAGRHGASGGEDRNGGPETFRASVVETVTDHLGPRVRIDVRTTLLDREVDFVSGSADGRHVTDEPNEREAISVGDPPPRSADVATAVASLPAPDAAGERVNGSRLIVRTW